MFLDIFREQRYASDMNVESRHQNPDSTNSNRRRLRVNGRIAAGAAFASVSLLFGALLTEQIVKQDLSADEASGGFGTGGLAAGAATVCLWPRKR